MCECSCLEHVLVFPWGDGELLLFTSSLIVLKIKVVNLIFLRWGFSNRTLSVYEWWTTNLGFFWPLPPFSRLSSLVSATYHSSLHWSFCYKVMQVFMVTDKKQSNDLWRLLSYCVCLSRRKGLQKKRREMIQSEW